MGRRIFSKHTFEVDMVKGNEGYLKKLIEKTYVDKKANLLVMNCFSQAKQEP